jgi:hypothetical protein
MKISQSLVALGLLTLLALAAAGLFLTRDTGEAAQGKPLPGHRAPLVDEEPIQARIKLGGAAAGAAGAQAGRSRSGPGIRRRPA